MVKKNSKKKIILLIMIAGLSFVIYIIFQSEFHIDLSQSYRSIDGYENIVFRDNWSGQKFRRCLWGLIKVNDESEFTDHKKIDKNSLEYRILSERIEMHDVDQIVLSPDGESILYVERIYRGTGVTDDEDVYFRVYNISDDTITTIYSGFRQFLRVDWKK